MAVLPEDQRTGIGSQLVDAGLQAWRAADHGIVVVLGHPHDAPRCGFTPSKPYGMVWEQDVSEEACMVKELKPGVLAQTQRVVRDRPEFDTV